MKFSLLTVVATVLAAVQTAALPVSGVSSLPSAAELHHDAPAGPRIVAPAATDYEGIRSFVAFALQNISRSIVNFNETMQAYVDKPSNTKLPSASADALLVAINSTAETLTLPRYDVVFFGAEDSQFVDTVFHEMYRNISQATGLLRDNVRVVAGKKGARVWLAEFLPASEHSFAILFDALMSFIQSEKYTARMERTLDMLNQELFDTLNAFDMTDDSDSEASEEDGDEAIEVMGEQPQAEGDELSRIGETESAEQLFGSSSSLVRLEKYIEQTRKRINLELDELHSSFRKILLNNSTAISKDDC